jgi:hypothetical protein
MIMGNLHYSRIKCYWDTKHVIQISIVANNMPLNRFFKLRQNLHFVDVTNKDPTSKTDFGQLDPQDPPRKSWHGKWRTRGRSELRLNSVTAAHTSTTLASVALIQTDESVLYTKEIRKR